METLDLKFTAKSAGNQVRGVVSLRMPYGVQLEPVHRELGEELVDALRDAVSAYRPADEAQPETVEDALPLLSTTVMVSSMVSELFDLEYAPHYTSWRLGEIVDSLGIMAGAEPRFAKALAHAIAAETQVNQLEMHIDDDLFTPILEALPLIEGPIKRPTRVAVLQGLGKVGEEPDDATVKSAFTNFVEFSAEEFAAERDAGRLEEDAVVLPLPLFAPGQLDNSIETTVRLEDVLATIRLEVKRPAFGLLRTLVERVEDFRAEVAIAPPLHFYSALAHAHSLVRLAQQDAFVRNGKLRKEVLEEIKKVAPVIEGGGEQYQYGAELLVEAAESAADLHPAEVAESLRNALKWLPENIAEKVPPARRKRLSMQDTTGISVALNYSAPGRIVVVFYEPEDNPHIDAFPDDALPDPDAFKPMMLANVDEYTFEGPTGYVFYCRV